MLAVAAAALLACNESDVKKYAISGTGLEDGAQVLLVDQITGEAIDTAVVARPSTRPSSPTALSPSRARLRRMPS